MTLNELLTKHGACTEAREWAATQPDLATAWRKCTRIDWMCWLAGRAIDERTMRHLACDFAETAWPYVGDEETLLQCILTVEIARGFADGTEDDETRAAAQDAAWVTVWAAATGDPAGYIAKAAARATVWAAATGAAGSPAADAARDATWSAVRSRLWAAAQDAAWVTVWATATRQQLRILRKRISAKMICRATGVL